jgi:hypothetical protein
MTTRVRFFDVFVMIGTGNDWFEPRRTILLGGKKVYPGARLPGDTKIGGIKLRMLIGGELDVREDENGQLLVIESARANSSPPVPP